MKDIHGTWEKNWSFIRAAAVTLMTGAKADHIMGNE
jgi:hypothetical protein